MFNSHQYRNELAVDKYIATEFVPFVRQQYPRDARMQVESLHLKMCALESILGWIERVCTRIHFGVVE